jgi:hypothetical protein
MLAMLKKSQQELQAITPSRGNSLNVKAWISSVKKTKGHICEPPFILTFYMFFYYSAIGFLGDPAAFFIFSGDQTNKN